MVWMARFSDRLRGVTEPPADLAAVVRWLKNATIPVADLNRPGNWCCPLPRYSTGSAASRTGPPPQRRTPPTGKRAVLNNLMQYAVETDVVPANPLKAVKWTRPRTLKTVDPRMVVNSNQARCLLAAVGQQGERGERMVDRHRLGSPAPRTEAPPARRDSPGVHFELSQ